MKKIFSILILTIVFSHIVIAQDNYGYSLDYIPTYDTVFFQDNTSWLTTRGKTRQIKKELKSYDCRYTTVSRISQSNGKQYIPVSNLQLQDRVSLAGCQMRKGMSLMLLGTAVTAGTLLTPVLFDIHDYDNISTIYFIGGVTTFVLDVIGFSKFYKGTLTLSGRGVTLNF